MPRFAFNEQLWKYGQEHGIVKAFSIEKEEFVDLEVDW